MLARYPPPPKKKGVVGSSDIKQIIKTKKGQILPELGGRIAHGHGSVLDVQNSDGLNSDSSKTDDLILASIFPAA